MVIWNFISSIINTMKKSILIPFIIFGNICFAQFTLPALPYSFEALEPNFDKETMQIHHDKHHDAYINQLNKQVESNPALKNKTVEDICKNISKYNMLTRNNAGGHYNHSLFWTILSPTGSLPTGTLMEDINKSFGSFDSFKSQFSDSAKTRFGSGWAWLIVDAKGKLKISSTDRKSVV